MKAPLSRYISTLKQPQRKDTSFEKEVLKLLADGYNVKEIAKIIFLSVGGLRKRIDFMKNKYQAKTNAQLVYNYFLK